MEQYSYPQYKASSPSNGTVMPIRDDRNSLPHPQYQQQLPTSSQNMNLLQMDESVLAPAGLKSPAPPIRTPLDEHRDRIRILYVQEDKSLDEVMNLMRVQHNLQASKNMYKKKIRQWNLRKRHSEKEPLPRVPKFSEPQKGIKDASGTAYQLNETVSPVESQGYRQKRSPSDDAASVQFSDNSEESITNSFSPTSTYSTSERTLFSGGLERASFSGQSFSGQIFSGHSFSGQSFTPSMDDIALSRRRSVSTQLSSNPSTPFSISEASIARKIKRALSPDDEVEEISNDSRSTAQAIVKRQRPSIRRSPNGNIPWVLPDPPALKMPMEMFVAIQAFISGRLEPRLESTFTQPSPQGILVSRKSLRTPQAIMDFQAAFEGGINAMSTGKAATYGAFFEKSFRLLNDILVSDHFCTVLIILNFIIEVERAKIPKLGRMLLKYFCGIALTVLGPNHPHVIWSRNLLVLYDTPHFLSTVLDAVSDTVQQTLGVDDDYSLLARLSSLDLSYRFPGEHPPVQKVIDRYEKLLHDCQNSNFLNTAYVYKSTKTSFGEFLKENGEYARAEEMFLDSLLQLGQTEDGVVASHLLHGVCSLAEVQGASGKDAEAEQTWRYATKRAAEVFGTEDNETLRLQQRYVNFLSSRGRESEVATLLANIDAKLEPFMLRPDLPDPDPI